MRRKAVLCDRQVIVSLCQPRVDFQDIGPQYGLLLLVLRGDALCFFQRFNSLACCIYSSLCRDEIEVRVSDLGGDLLTLRANIFARGVACKFGCADAKANLVLLRYGFIEGRSCEGCKLGG